MMKKITPLLLVPFVSFAANTDLNKELKQLKPLDNSGVEIKNIVESGSVYILKLKVKDNRGVKFVPAVVTKDKKHVVIGTAYNAETGEVEGVADLSKFEKDEAFNYGNPNAKGGDFYVFTDPDCPACKGLEKQIADEGLDKYGKIHVFFYPLDRLHPEARKKCEYILSLPKEKREEAYKKLDSDDSWRLYKATAEIKKQMSISIAYAHELGLRGTPSFFDKSGNEIDGRVFISYLRAIKKSTAPQGKIGSAEGKDSK